MVYIARCVNSDVTDYYLNTIGDMLESNGHSIRDYTRSCKPNANDIIIVGTALDCIKYYLIGFRKIVFWMQGIEPEESYLKHNSILRKLTLDIITLIALKISKACFFVSYSMLNYIELKYHIELGNKSFVMPCFNTTYQNGFKSVKNSDDYVFAYVGSLSKWQCFDKTIKLYKRIEDINSKSKLIVYTKELDRASTLISEVGLSNYEIKYVSPSRLQDELSKVNFGFVLRDDIAVNRVATPTKLSSYMAAGVIPIFSDVIKDFYNVTKGMKYVVPVEKSVDIDLLIKRILTIKIDYEELDSEYAAFFDLYYNKDAYIDNFGFTLNKLLGL